MAASSSPPMHVGSYKLTKTIKGGAAATTALATHKHTGREVAIKINNKGKVSVRSLERLMNEIRITKTLQNPNVVKIFEVFETRRKHYMALEHLSGYSVYDVIFENGRVATSIIVWKTSKYY